MSAEKESTAPFRVQHHECRCDDIPRELLFEWVDEDVITDGGLVETRKYEIPRYFEAHVTLDYLEILHSRGSDAAYRWAMIMALGLEGWKAVRSPGMDDETLQKISQVVLDRIRGAQSRGPKG